MKLKESLSSGQHDNNGNKGHQQDQPLVGQSQNSGSGNVGGHHIHSHPGVPQNELKMGLGGMSGVGPNLGGMMGHVGDKNNHDILKAVGKVNNISFYN